ncbi:MAG TPA: TetR/AcrR family transcriptional regulator [Solirubrobacteraceae bacterium]|jgi:AcrR family transcriptional regulator
MSTSTTIPSRRQRLRVQTLAEARDHAYAQIASGGPAALSLNGIAKAMGMSGPALYRYFASRDELMSTLVTESYEDLADTVDAAAEQARSRSPEQRLRAALDAVRDWALKAPHRYRLVFGSTYGSGELDPERIIPAAQRPMSVVLAALAEIDAGPGQRTVTDPVLRRQLEKWSENTNEARHEPSLLLLGVTAWTRMHGIISLEIEDIFDQMGIEPGRLYEAEIVQLIAQRRGRR